LGKSIGNILKMKKENKKRNILTKKSVPLCLSTAFLFAFFFFGISTASALSVKLEANPNPVLSGWPSTVSWQSESVNSCTMSGNSVGLSGFLVTPPLKVTTHYSITCTQNNACAAHTGYLPVYFPESDGNPMWGYSARTFCYAKTASGQSACNSVKASYDRSGYPQENVCYWGDVTTEDQVYIGITPNDQAMTNALTGEVTELGDLSARLNGSFNPGGEGSASGYFRYSSISPEKITPVFCNDVYGSEMKSTNEVNLGGASETTTFSTTITGLSPNTKYFYCAVGSSKNGIIYGGVKSFITRFPALSIETKNATVVSGTLAYLNATYNTPVKAITYFEYRKRILEYQQNDQPFGAPVSNASPFNFITYLKNSLVNFLKTSEVLAANTTNNTSGTGTNQTNPTISNDWIQVGEKNHGASTSGDISYLLKDLRPGTSYEYRAVIKTQNADENINSNIAYGDILSFITRPLSTTNPGEVPNGGGYVDPCVNPDDPNCNGTGGDGTGHDKEIGPGLPDLTTGAVTPGSAIANTPSRFFANVRNQGTGPTGKSFFGFFQISNVNPALFENQIQKPAGNVSFWEKLFGPKMAQAANATNAPGTPVGAGQLNNLPGIPIPSLLAKTSFNMSTQITFPSIGTYYLRACADKSSIADPGLVKESYENNNCGSWTTITIGNSNSLCTDPAAQNVGSPLPCTYGGSGICTDPNAVNPGEPLPCRYVEYPPDGTFCNDPGALNQGSPLPCTYQTGICLDSKALNYELPLPCRYAITPPGGICQDSKAKNYGSPLPCIYQTGICLDSSAINYQYPLPCRYAITPPGGSCLNPAAKNYGSPLPCIFTSNFCTNSSAINYGSPLPCRYNNNNENSGSNENLTLGQIATPPVDAIVRYHEGIEHVFVRQILANTEIQRVYGYQAGSDLQNFAWNLADLLARTFGYVAENGREIRVSLPDIAAYELRLSGNQLTVYEYFDSKIVNIESTTTMLRGTYEYEYYFVKR
jgi:hypothetical protein